MKARQDRPDRSPNWWSRRGERASGGPAEWLGRASPERGSWSPSDARLRGARRFPRSIGVARSPAFGHLQGHVATADMVTAVESDVALIIAVMRLANEARPPAERVETVVAAVERLTPQAVQSVASRVRTFDFFERSKRLGHSARAFPLARARYPAHCRPARGRGGLRASRPPHCDKSPARRGQARLDSRLSRLHRPGQEGGPNA